MSCENIDTVNYYFFGEYTYLERLGALRFIVEGWVGCDLVVGANPEWLRCYQDDEVHYKTPMFLSQSIEDCEYVQVSAIDEIPVLNYLNIRPNPTTDYWLLDWDYSEKAQLQLLDIQGNLIRTQTILPGQQKISAQDLPSGLYLMKVKGDTVWGSVRVVKQ